MPQPWQDRITKLDRVPANTLTPNPDNARQHPEHQRQALLGSLDTQGWTGAVTVNERTGYLLDGHARLEAALGNDPDMLVPVLYVDLAEHEEAQFLAQFDWITTLATYDVGTLEGLLHKVNSDDERVQQSLADMAEAVGLDWTETADTDPAIHDSLTDRFLVPPFSVLDARQGYWLERRRAWMGLGIESEIGREGGRGQAGLIFTQSAQNPTIYKLRNQMAERLGYAPPWADVVAEAERQGLYLQQGTSVFDPVLCEVAYTWFCPPDGRVLDPFAGGSVRGIVAHRLGRDYTGVELREEQVAANVVQGEAITPDPMPRWIVGDSLHIGELAPGAYDLLFTCPPYADLEVYSDDPRDISTMDYPAFLATYRQIVAASCALLRDNRFAVVVVGDMRDKHGHYRNFVADTVAAFRDAGLHLYNEAIFITPLGSLPVRAASTFTASRKLGKTHQNVLVFLKGNAKAATEACGQVTVDLSVLGEGAEQMSLAGDA